MSFDLLAPHYRWMEWLLAGGKLQRCRTACLGMIPAPAKVLIYGEGNGRFLAALCREFPEAEVTSVPSRIAEVSRAIPARVTQESVGPGSPSPLIAT